ncbi:MAG TPA: hypothetical protein VGP72_01130 [Planctomycetota bacterium]
MNNHIRFGVIAGALLLCVQFVSAAEAQKAGLPAGAKGFAGIVSGKVTGTHADFVMFEVSKITNTWKHSKAEKADALVGQKVLVTAPAEGKNAKDIARYLKGLKVGDETSFDVKAEGDSLVVQELTDAQKGNAGSKKKRD